MGNDFFRFQQFTVYQDQCAMKVGTDGILLGAWADVTQAQRVLDIGTGTGLLALMIAQRAAEAQITAVEIDGPAAGQAQQNVARSPWAERITVYHQAIQQFVLTHPQKYELVVCNPPFFVTGRGVASPQADRQTARHTQQLPVPELLACVRVCLAPAGVFSVIVPELVRAEWVALATQEQLHLVRQTVVYPLPHKPAHRSLLSFSLEPRPLVTSELIIETQHHQYTPQFAQLTQSFYLFGQG